MSVVRAQPSLLWVARTHPAVGVSRRVDGTTALMRMVEPRILPVFFAASGRRPRPPRPSCCCPRRILYHPLASASSLVIHRTKPRRQRGLSEVRDLKMTLPLNYTPDDLVAAHEHTHLLPPIVRAATAHLASTLPASPTLRAALPVRCFSSPSAWPPRAPYLLSPSWYAPRRSAGVPPSSSCAGLAELSAPGPMPAAMSVQGAVGARLPAVNVFSSPSVVFDAGFPAEAPWCHLSLAFRFPVAAQWLPLARRGHVTRPRGAYGYAHETSRCPASYPYARAAHTLIVARPWLPCRAALDHWSGSEGEEDAQPLGSCRAAK
ncbi:hypothetical protein DFH06DRAFT_1478528 [Mycena polygramma]|nr:hypothetical protein DFH06DRAFT_1478528 [Mycena polygramma]